MSVCDECTRTDRTYRVNLCADCASKAPTLPRGLEIEKLARAIYESEPGEEGKWKSVAARAAEGNPYAARAVTKAFRAAVAVRHVVAFMAIALSMEHLAC